jgi:hypothetical protein
MTGSYDTSSSPLPDGPFKEWPGAGPVPEPEEEGFREKVLKAREERRKQEREEQEERNQEASDFYSGRTLEGSPTPKGRGTKADKDPDAKAPAKTTPTHTSKSHN